MSRLVRAARDGNFAQIVEIVEANPECVDHADIFGETALHESIYHGHDEIAMYLLDCGASPCLCRKDSSSPLHIAANKGRYHVAKALLKNESVRNTINKKDSLGNTALHAACKKTQVDLVQLLVDHGANTNYVNRRGQKPIDYTRDVRLFRILRGNKWYDDLNGDAIVDRLKKGEARVVTAPNSSKKNKKKRRRRGGKNRNKNKKHNKEDATKGNEEQKEQVVMSKKKKRKQKWMKEDNVSNKALDVDLKTWLEFNDSLPGDKLQKYQLIYFDRKLKLKWLHEMQSLRKQNLQVIEYNRQMCSFADGLYLEYSQPQYDCNHYIPEIWDEQDDEDDRDF
eukprot:251363_1